MNKPEAKLLSDLKMYDLWKTVLDNKQSILVYKHPAEYNQTLCVVYGKLVEKAVLKLNGFKVREPEEPS